MKNYRMGPKQSLARNPLVITLCLVMAALVVGLGFRLTSKEAVAEAVNREGEQSLQAAPTQPIAAEEVAVVATATLRPALLAQTVNGISISASNARLESGQFSVDVCYDKPDHSNWLLRGATLEFGGGVVDSFAATPIVFRDPPVDGQQRVTTFVDGNPVETWEPAGDSNKGQRCDTLVFDLGSEPSGDLAGEAYSLTVQAIRMFPDEGTECEVYLTVVQAALDAQNTGIQLACVTGDQGAVVTVVSKPDEMSQEAADTLAFSGDTFKIFGPWAFSGTLD